MSNVNPVTEKSVSWHGLYILADRALLPTRIETEQGDFDVEPIRQFDYRSRLALIEALAAAFMTGNPEAEVPPLENKKKPTPMEKLVGAKSWTDLERKYIYFSIMVYPSTVRLESWARASDGTWSDEKETALDITIPLSAGVEGVADTILEHLRTRRDLPGVTFDFPQPKTAKGA